MTRLPTLQLLHTQDGWSCHSLGKSGSGHGGGRSLFSAQLSTGRPMTTCLGWSVYSGFTLRFCCAFSPFPSPSILVHPSCVNDTCRALLNFLILNFEFFSHPGCELGPPTNHDCSLSKSGPSVAFPLCRFFFVHAPLARTLTGTPTIQAVLQFFFTPPSLRPRYTVTYSRMCDDIHGLTASERRRAVTCLSSRLYRVVPEPFPVRINPIYLR